MGAHDASLTFLGLLDLPEHSSITIDGEPVVIRRSDFVGFFNLPTASEGADGGSFHFVSVRAASSRQRSGQSQPSSVVVGFVIPSQGSLIRRYDPLTEEVSSKDVDALTVGNLLTSVHLGKIDSQRIVDYAKLLDPPKQRSWSEGTGLVSFRLLGRRGLGFGNKIVPGAFGGNCEEATTHLNEVDGAPAAYPPIPVLPKSSKADPIQRPLHRLHHPGTKRYLSELDPTSRTNLLVDPDSCTRAFESVLRDCYNGCWQDLVGDVQLSHILFLQLHCYASLTHWRDLVAMLSFVNPAALSLDRPTVGSLFACLLRTLSWQVMTMDEGLFDDMELSGDNVLIPSFKRLLLVDDNLAGTAWQASRNGLQRILQQRFPSQFSHAHDPSEAVRPCDLQDVSDGGSCDDAMDDDDDDDDDEDGPVVVACDEVDASVARISFDRATSPRHVAAVEYSGELREQYPLLFAARVPSEDIVMTCARVLDQANDASLVREAADYLQRIEAAQQANHRVVDEAM
jgi:AAR2 protein